MTELYQVGAITQTHGIRGEVKVFPMTDDVSRFKNMKELILDTGKEQITGFVRINILYSDTLYTLRLF